MRKPMRRRLTTRTLPCTPSHQKVTPRHLRERDGGHSGRLRPKRAWAEARDFEARVSGGARFLGRKAAFRPSDDQNAREGFRFRRIDGVAPLLPEENRPVVLPCPLENGRERRHVIDRRASASPGLRGGGLG